MADQFLDIINAATGKAPKPLQPAVGDMESPDLAQTSQEAFLGTVKHGLAMRESGNNYNAKAPNSSATGKYQFIDSTRQMFLPGSTREDFQSNPDMQEKAMDSLLAANLNTFKKSGIDTDSMNKGDLAGLLWAAHLQGAGAAVKLFKGGEDSGGDANGVTASNYFQAGKKHYLNSQSNPGLVNAPGESTLSNTMASGQMPFKISDYLKGAFQEDRNHTLSGQWAGVLDQVNPVIEEIQKKTGKAVDLDTNGIFNRYFKGDNILGDPIGDLGKKYQAMADNLSRTNPDVKVPDFSDLLDKTAQSLNEHEREISDQTKRVGLAPYITSFIPAAAGWMSDPFNTVSSAAIGLSLGAAAPAASATLAGSALLQGGVAMGLTQALQEPLVQHENALFGREHGLTQALTDVATTALGGAVSVGALGALGKAIGMGFKGKTSVKDVAEALGTKEGTENLAKRLELSGNLTDAEAARHLNEQLEANPAGRSPGAIEGMSNKLDQMFANVQEGKAPTAIPQDVGGIQGKGSPLTDLDLASIQALHDEGFIHADKVGPGISAIRDGIGEAGDISAEEWTHLPPAEGEVPSALERITQERHAAQDRISADYADLTIPANKADAELQSKLSQWGTTAEIQEHKIDYRVQQLTDRTNAYEAKLAADEDFTAGRTGTNPWSDSKGYETKVAKYGHEEATDQARRHTAKQLEADRQELLNLNELKKGIGKSAEAPTIDELTNRITAAKTDLPNAQATVLNKMDLAEAQTKGLNQRIIDNNKQVSIYQQRMEELRLAKGAELDEFDTHALKMQSKPFQDAIDNLMKESIEASQHLENLKEQIKQNTASLKEVQQAVREIHSVDETNLSPLAQAEEAIRAIREESAHDSTIFPLEGDEFGKITAQTTIPEQVQATAEKYSALRALKDCIGR